MKFETSKKPAATVVLTLEEDEDGDVLLLGNGVKIAFFDSSDGTFNRFRLEEGEIEGLTLEPEGDSSGYGRIKVHH